VESIVIGPGIVIGVISGLLLLLATLIGLLYYTMRDRVNRLERGMNEHFAGHEAKVELRFTDMDQHIRHGLRETNTNVHKLALMVYGRKGNDSDQVIEFTTFRD